MIMGVISVCVFLSTTLLVFSILGVFANSTMMKPIHSDNDKQSHFLLRSKLAPLIRYLENLNNKEWCETHRRILDTKLLHAGRPIGAISVTEFMAGAQLMSLLVFIVFLCLGVGFQNIITLGLIMGLLAAFTTYWFCVESLQNTITQRKKLLSRQFPSFLDLAVMAAKAGANFVETLQIYILNNRDNALGTEFSIVSQDIKLGSTLEEALLGFKSRIPLEPIRNSIDAIIQGQNIGTPLADVLSDQADAIRFHRTQVAERAAEELKVKIMGPIILMMISVFLLILGPAVIEVLQSGMV